MVLPNRASIRIKLVNICKMLRTVPNIKEPLLLLLYFVVILSRKQDNEQRANKYGQLMVWQENKAG